MNVTEAIEYLRREANVDMTGVIDLIEEIEDERDSALDRLEARDAEMAELREELRTLRPLANTVRSIAAALPEDVITDAAQRLRYRMQPGQSNHQMNYNWAKDYAVNWDQLDPKAFVKISGV